MKFGPGGMQTGAESYELVSTVLLGFRAVSLGDATITFKTIPDWDTVIGCSPNNYDQQLISHNIILHQVSGPSNQAIPTLSEWGMIIFMTLILGISVVMLYRRREI